MLSKPRPGRRAGLLIVSARRLILLSAMVSMGAGLARAEQPPPPRPRATVARQLTPQQALRLKERDKFSAQATALQIAGKLAEAISAEEQKLAIEREVLGAENAETISTLRHLAGMHLEQGDFATARRLDVQALNATMKRPGQEHALAVTVRRELETAALLEKLDPAGRQQYLQSVPLARTAQRLRGERKFSDAVAPALRVTEIYRKVFGDKNFNYATSLNSLGVIYYSVPDFAKAEAAFRQALEIRKATLGEKHADYVTTLNNLANVYYRSRDYTKAEPLYEQLLQIRKEAVGEKHADYAIALNNLANVYYLTRDYAKAEPLYQKVLQIRKETGGEKNADYASALNNLGWLYRMTGDYAKAEPLLRQALDIRKEVLGEKHKDYATSLARLADLYEAKGDYKVARNERIEESAKDARVPGAHDRPTKKTEQETERSALLEKLDPEQRQQYLQVLELERNVQKLRSDGKFALAVEPAQQAAEMLRKIVGEKDRNYATSISNLAGLYYSMRDYAKAVPLYEQAVAIRKVALGEKHADYTACLNLLANAYRGNREYAKAEKLYEEALKVRKETLGEKNADYATSLSNLGGLYLVTGDYAKAEPLLRQALEVRRQVLDEKHRDFGTSLDLLADLYGEMGNDAAALKLRQEILARDTKLLGENNWQTASARIAVDTAALLQKLDPSQRQEYAQCAELDRSIVKLRENEKYAQAVAPAAQALEVRRKIFGQKDPNYAHSLMTLAELYYRTADYSKAEPLLQQSLQIYKQTLGEKHPNYALNLNDLGRLHYSLGDYAGAEQFDSQALEIRKGVLGEKSALYTSSLNNLALVYKVRGDYAKAELLFQNAIQRYKDDYGEQHPDYATEVNNLADLCTSMGDYGKAERLYLQAFQIRKEMLGVKHLDYANSLVQLGKIYSKMGEYAKAQPFYQQAIEIQKETLGEQHPTYATSLNDLAALYVSMAEYAKAEPLFQQAIQIRKHVLGETHPNYATSLVSLAELYKTKGDYAKAETLLRQALQIRQESLGEKHPSYATDLDDLAMLYETMGDYAKAEPLCRQSLQIRKEALGEKHPDYAMSLDNLATLHEDLGDYAKAESCYLAALEIRKAALGEKHPDYATSLDNLAALYKAKGAYRKAEPFYRQALQIRKDALGEQHPVYATSLSSLAGMYTAMGDYTKAEPLYRQALEIRKEALGEKHPDYAASLSSLAALYTSIDEYAKAEPLSLQALEIRKTALGIKHPDYASSVNSLARLYSSTGDYAKAEPLFQQALQIRKDVLGEHHPTYAKSLHNLGRMYSSMGEYAKAEPLYLQALQIRKETLGENHPSYATSLDCLAALYYFMGEHAKAEPLSRQALQISRDELDLTAAVQSERQQLKMAGNLSRFLHDYLSIAQSANVPAGTVYADVLAWKGAVSARQQAMRRMRASIADGKLAGGAAIFDELTARSRELSNRMAIVPEPGHEAEHRRTLADLNAQIERLEQSLAALSGDFQRELAERKRTPADIQRCLPADAALVDLFEYTHLAEPAEKGTKPAPQRWLAAFVVRQSKPIEWIDLGPVEPIAAAIESWRLQLGPGVHPHEQVEGAELRRLVWDKLESQLVGAKTVLLSPDGATARFPWPALPGRQPGTYLIEDVGIAIVAIPRLLPELLASDEPSTVVDKKLPAEPSLFLLGDVDFDGDPGKQFPPMLAQAAPQSGRSGELRHWPPLPATRTEMAAIADSFEEQYPDAKLAKLRGDKATKGTVAAKIGNYRYVHLATHGFFAPPELKSAWTSGSRSADSGDNESVSRQDIAGYQPGLLSGLVLAGANQPAADGKDDGILTALEVSQLDLSHVELATLSACETGLGQSAGGEGLLGLQRAFQISGTKSVVATLWTVSDDASRALMVDFYDNLWKRKLSKLESLRQAQLKMLREGIQRGVVRDDQPATVKIRRLPPYYWAPFALSGDWR